MGKETESEKKPIRGSWLSEQQQEVVAALQKMTGGKYQVRTLFGPMITGQHPYLFDRKGDLTKTAEKLMQAKGRIERLLQTIEGFDELGLSEVIDTEIRRRARNQTLETAFDLILYNGIRAGVTNVLDEYLKLLNAETDEYLKRIKDAEIKWPKGKTMPQSIHVARQIAKIYVEYIGKKPTYGTNSGAKNVGMADTTYSIAVEAIFKALDISKNTADSAKDAANEYTDDSAAQAKKDRDSEQARLWLKSRGFGQ